LFQGCGVVEFSSGEAAQKAITELSDRPLLGRPVFIREVAHQEIQLDGDHNQLISKLFVNRIVKLILVMDINLKGLSTLAQPLVVVVVPDVNCLSQV
jgi:RNA recognition motif-containing protein